MIKKSPFLSIICNTRSRPEAVYKLLDSIYTNIYDKDNIEVLFRVDNDDPKLRKIEEIILLFQEQHFNVHLIVGARYGSKGSSVMFNELASRASGDWIWTIEDEIEFITKDFDLILKSITSRLKDTAYIISIPDNNKFPFVACNAIIGRKFYDYFQYLFHREVTNADIWIEWIFRNLDRVLYFPDIRIKDISSRVTKKALDNTAKEAAVSRKTDKKKVKRQWKLAFSHRKEFARYLGINLLNRKWAYLTGNLRYIFVCLTISKELTRLSRFFLIKKMAVRLLKLIPGLIVRG